MAARLALSILALGFALAGSAFPVHAADDVPAAKASGTTEPPASPLYKEVVLAYMEGRWDVLEKTLREKMRELAALSTEQQADIATIRVALREGRQAWWAATKAGAKTPIHASLWATIPVVYEPKLSGGTKITSKNGLLTLSASWPSADMDSTAPGEHGFTRGDAACLTAFANLGSVYAASALPPAAKTNVIPQERYLEFRGKVTGIAYGTPGARRYGMWICLASYSDETAKLQIRMARRAIASTFIGELLTHSEAYPSIELPKTLATENAEEGLCKTLADSVEKRPWSLAEDTAVRSAIKLLGGANGVNACEAGAITLPNKLTVELDPKLDEPKLAQRNAWLKEKFDKLAASP